MAIFDPSNAEQPFSYSDASSANRYFEFRTWQSTNVDANGDGTYTFESAGAAIVTLSVTGLTTDAENIPTRRSFNNVSIALLNGNENAPDVVISDFDSIALGTVDIAEDDKFGDLIWGTLLSRVSTVIGTLNDDTTAFVPKLTNPLLFDTVTLPDWTYINASDIFAYELGNVE